MRTHCDAGYHYTGAAVVAILLSAVLGLLVSLSTFLVIGATSSLTYNVIGHVKVIPPYAAAAHLNCAEDESYAHARSNFARMCARRPSSS